ncbi:MAG: helix-turn-helix domain-containing protein [Anaerorhabdus sp.]|uniref:helix-turn-helix domain-containing protein n=1 Tax=Anaerorhabdus sp. TaxID=1872524 RepID=UPI003A86A54A
MNEINLKIKAYLNGTEIDLGDVKFDISQTIEPVDDLKLYTTSEIANLLGVGEDYINLLRNNHALVATQLGKRFMYSRKEIKNFQENFEGCELANREMIMDAVKNLHKKKSSTPGK